MAYELDDKDLIILNLNLTGASYEEMAAAAGMPLGTFKHRAGAGHLNNKGAKS